MVRIFPPQITLEGFKVRYHPLTHRASDGGCNTRRAGKRNSQKTRRAAATPRVRQPSVDSTRNGTDSLRRTPLLIRVLRHSTLAPSTV
jgi:hypothetical protein